MQLTGWTRKRRTVVLRRKRPDPSGLASLPLLADGGVEVVSGPVYEYVVLVTSLAENLLTIAHLYRQRADVENAYDELKRFEQAESVPQRADQCCGAVAVRRALAEDLAPHPGTLPTAGGGLSGTQRLKSSVEGQKQIKSERPSQSFSERARGTFSFQLPFLGLKGDRFSGAICFSNLCVFASLR